MDLGPQIVKDSYQYLLNQSGANPITLGDNESVNWGAAGVIVESGDQSILGVKTFSNLKLTSNSLSNRVVTTQTNGIFTTLSRTGIDARSDFPNSIVNAATAGAAPSTVARRDSDGSINFNEIYVSGLSSVGSNYFEGVSNYLSTCDFVYNGSAASKHTAALAVVSLTGNQTISGIKTFATGISAPNVVYNTGSQIISGAKTFANGLTVSGGFNVVGGGPNYFGSGISTNYFGSGAATNIVGSQFSANLLSGAWNVNGGLSVVGGLTSNNPSRITLQNFTGLSNQAGFTGECRVSGAFLYVCTGAGSGWGRVALTSF